MADENQRSRARMRISQETIAIVTVGVALAGLNLVTTADLRDLRTEWQAESRQLRNEARASREELRNEARADREELRNESRADREAFQREILRLTQQQAELVASAQAKNE